MLDEISKSNPIVAYFVRRYLKKVIKIFKPDYKNKGIIRPLKSIYQDKCSLLDNDETKAKESLTSELKRVIKLIPMGKFITNMAMKYLGETIQDNVDVDLDLELGPAENIAKFLPYACDPPDELFQGSNGDGGQDYSRFGDSGFGSHQNSQSSPPIYGFNYGGMKATARKSKRVMTKPELKARKVEKPEKIRKAKAPKPYVKDDDKKTRKAKAKPKPKQPSIR
jgi:hypothetical protein